MVRPPIDAEGPETEWKEVLPRDGRVARTLGAFANGCGGTLWIGVSDSGEVVGVDSPRAVRDELVRAAEERLQPPAEITVRVHDVEGLNVLEARVVEAKDKPVRVLVANGHGVIYVRDGSSSRPAESSSVRALERGTTRRRRLDAKSRRLLACLERLEDPTLPRLARAARMGRRAVRRLLVTLVQAGLVQEREGRRLALTPRGHRASRSGPKGAR